MGFSAELSALRGLAASSVVATHTWLWLAAAGIVPAAVVTILWPIQTLGWLGVSVFLGLSIYLLMGRLDTDRDLRRYFYRRLKRIWPLYVVACIAVWTLLTPRSLGTLAWNISCLAIFFPSHQFHTSGWTTTYVLWTLQMEEWVYLCLPLVALLGHRSRMGLAITLVGAGTIAGILGASYFTPWPWLTCYGFGLLAREWKGRFPSPVVPLLSIPAAMIIGWPLGLLVVGPALVTVLRSPPHFLKRTVLVAIGECSYALYLFHLLFLDLLGIAGIPLAYLFAWSVEYLQRGGTIRARLDAVRS